MALLTFFRKSYPRRITCDRPSYKRYFSSNFTIVGRSDRSPKSSEPTSIGPDTFVTRSRWHRLASTTMGCWRGFVKREVIKRGEKQWRRVLREAKGKSERKRTRRLRREEKQRAASVDERVEMKRMIGPARQWRLSKLIEETREADAWWSAQRCDENSEQARRLISFVI